MLRMKEASEYTGLPAQTPRKLIDEGEIRANRIGSKGNRYVEKRELDRFNRFVGRRPSRELEGWGCVIHARVFTKEQEGSGNLDGQKSRLVDYCVSNDYHVEHIVTDVASGINENRRGLAKLVELSKKEKISRIVIEYKGRLARFDHEYLKEFFLVNNVKIDCVNENDEKSYGEELVKDMLTIVPNFSARLYGRRGSKKIEKGTREAIEECI